jgi:pyruvate/2-oxoglutarate dehydrogenase complex dihydrolipoamide dehydrogenase (E3) component
MLPLFDLDGHVPRPRNRKRIIMAPPAGKQARPSRRAIVIGGSIAGLFVAALLRRIGWQVDIYERSSVELIGRGVEHFCQPSGVV